MVLNRSGLATAILVPIHILASPAGSSDAVPRIILVTRTDSERGIQTEAVDSPEIEGETDTEMDAGETHFSLYDTAQRKKFGRQLECYVEPDGGRFSLRIENVTLPNRFKTPAKAFNAWKHGLYVTMTNEFKITSAITYVAKCILPPPPLECMHEQYDYNE